MLSEIESPLSDELALFFSERIKETIAGPNAFAVIPDPDTKSRVPELIQKHLANHKQGLVPTSQAIAKHLHAIQTGVNPGGLLTVIDCAVGKGKPTLAILKLEREEGVRLQKDQIQGKATFQLSHIRDLILTEKTKLYKIGLFVSDKGKLAGMVCDQQRGFQPRIEVASFFLSDFLGFRLLLDPALSTKHFFEAVEDFINLSVSDPVDQATYHSHLVSETASNRPSINPRKFANDYLKVPDRQTFVQYLADSGVPSESFPKDLELVSARLKTTILEFESGIQVRGSRDAMAERVTLKRKEGREVEATVRDNLKRVRNR